MLQTILCRSSAFAAAVILTTVISASYARAAIPQRMLYTGYMTDVTTGEPITGPINMVFRLYLTADEVAPFWEEFHTMDLPVDVQDGFFSVQLGEFTPLEAGMFDLAEVYLGLTIANSLEMQPRQRLFTLPYAFRASSSDTAAVCSMSEDAQQLQGHSWNDVAPAGHKHPGTDITTAVDYCINAETVQGYNVMDLIDGLQTTLAEVRTDLSESLGLIGALQTENADQTTLIDHLSGDLAAVQSENVNQAVALQQLQGELTALRDQLLDPACPRGYLQDAAATTFTLCRKGPDEMVKVGDFWIDRYEATVWSSPGCNGQHFGIDEDDYDTAGFPNNGQFTTPLFACSTLGEDGAGVLPSRFLTWFQAQAACHLAGKHLATNEEWQAAVIGTPDPGVLGGEGGTCLTSGDVAELLRITGVGTNCASYWGAQDMIGNVSEWVANWSGQGTTLEDGYQPPEYNGDLYRNVRVAEFQGVTGGGFPAAAVRGGAKGDGVLAGAFAYRLDYAPSKSVSSFGFRCARNY